MWGRTDAPSKCRGVFSSFFKPHPFGVVFLHNRMYFHNPHHTPTTLLAYYRNFLSAYPDWEIQEEQLLVYWIYTYFCGAVYDDQIFAKVKMAVLCTSMIHDLAVGTYLANDHHFEFHDLVFICYRFSRELEHSDLNLNAIERLMDEDEIFRFENLLLI